jgi:hypothetical protein
MLYVGYSEDFRGGGNYGDSPGEIWTIFLRKIPPTRTYLLAIINKLKALPRCGQTLFQLDRTRRDSCIEARDSCDGRVVLELEAFPVDVHVEVERGVVFGTHLYGSVNNLVDLIL